MKNTMRACSVVEIITPKKVLLSGLWFGPYFAPPSHKASGGHGTASKGKPSKPKRAIIWIHGLGSSAFSKLDIVQKLAGKNTAVIIFNNRGHDKVSSIHTVQTVRGGSAPRRSGLRPREGGSAHEVFTDCVDDIQGAINFVKRAGAKDIWLVGHSTGCQKSIYWASRKGRGVKGIVLLAPISDYSAEMYLKGKRKIERAVKYARALVARGKKHQLLPSDIWPDYFDAQRFLSLYTPDSREEMFTYAKPKKIPRLLQSVKLPILAVFAGMDEYADRPAIDIAEWFERNTEANLETLVVPSAPHSFHGKETQVSTAIKDWIGGQ